MNLSMVLLVVALSFISSSYASESSEPRVETSLILGKFQMTSNPRSDDYKEYLKAMEVNPIFRFMARQSKLTVEVGKAEGNNTNKYFMKQGTLVFSKVASATFELGKEFEFTLPDGRETKCVITFEGNKMTHAMKLPDFEATTVYEMTKDGLKSTLKCKNAVAVLDYKRVSEFEAKDDE